MSGLDLFSWWTLTISFSSIFLAAISIYLYIDSRPRRREEDEQRAERANRAKLVKDFTFVWVLLGLLIFYIFSIQLALTQIGAGGLSEVAFAVGNIIVEALLVFYLLSNREKTPAEK